MPARSRSAGRSRCRYGGRRARARRQHRPRAVHGGRRARQNRCRARASCGSRSCACRRLYGGCPVLSNKARINGKPGGRVWQRARGMRGTGRAVACRVRICRDDAVAGSAMPVRRASRACVHACAHMPDRPRAQRDEASARRAPACAVPAAPGARRAAPYVCAAPTRRAWPRPGATGAVMNRSAPGVAVCDRVTERRGLVAEVVRDRAGRGEFLLPGGGSKAWPASRPARRIAPAYRPEQAPERPPPQSRQPTPLRPVIACRLSIRRS